jgi:hypothetical protein
MKFILFHILACVAIAAVAAEPPPPDKGKKLYQKRCWFLSREVAWPQPDTLADVKKAIEIERERFKLEQEKVAAKNMVQQREEGNQYFSWGLLLLFLGLTATFALKQYGLQMVGIGLFSIGLAVAAKGLVQLKMAEHWEASTGGLIVFVIFGVVAFIFKESGIDDWAMKWWKNRKAKKEATADVVT